MAEAIEDSPRIKTESEMRRDNVYRLAANAGGYMALLAVSAYVSKGDPEKAGFTMTSGIMAKEIWVDNLVSKFYKGFREGKLTEIAGDFVGRKVERLRNRVSGLIYDYVPGVEFYNKEERSKKQQEDDELLRRGAEAGRLRNELMKVRQEKADLAEKLELFEFERSLLKPEDLEPLRRNMAVNFLRDFAQDKEVKDTNNNRLGSMREYVDVLIDKGDGEIVAEMVGILMDDEMGQQVNSEIDHIESTMSEESKEEFRQAWDNLVERVAA